MIKDIWHTTDETPESCEDIAFYVDGYLYSGYYEPQYNQYGIFGASKVEKWCYKRELSSYILALETDLECMRKALDVAVDALKEIKDGKIPVSLGINMDINDALDKITALTEGAKNE